MCEADKKQTDMGEGVESLVSKSIALINPGKCELSTSHSLLFWSWSSFYLCSNKTWYLGNCKLGSLQLTQEYCKLKRGVLSRDYASAGRTNCSLQRSHQSMGRYNANNFHMINSCLMVRIHDSITTYSPPGRITSVILGFVSMPWTTILYSVQSNACASYDGNYRYQSQ